MIDANQKDPYGRLLKKEDIPEDNEHFSIQSYAWLQFKADDLVLPDNPRASVVAHELHDPQELRTKVTCPRQFSKALRSPAKPLLPVDLADDYRKYIQETMQRRKRRNLDDDDTSTIDFSEIATPPDLEDRFSKWKSRGNRDDEAPLSSPPAHGEETPPQGVETSQPAQPAESVQPISAEGGESAPAASEHLILKKVPTGGNQNEPMKPASDVSTEARDRALAALNEKTGGDLGEASLKKELFGEEPPDTEADPIVSTDDAAGPADAGVGQETTEHLPEPSSPTEPPVVEAALHEGPTEGEALGEEVLAAPGPEAQPEHQPGPADAGPEEQQASFEEGRKEGLREAQEKYRELHSMLTETKNQMEQIRADVLKEGREIFSEMMRLSAERILRTELKTNDTALQRLFSQAVDSLHSHQGSLAVKAHPDTLDRVRSQFEELGLPFKNVEWTAAEDLPVGDFSLESDDEAVKVQLDKLVEEEIQNLSKDLFGSSEASKSEDGRGEEANEEPGEKNANNDDEEVS